MPEPESFIPTLVRHARIIAATPRLWHSAVTFDPDSRFRTHLHSAPEYEAWLQTWLPGQSTDWHDHGDGSGVLVVLQGSLLEHLAWDDPTRPAQIDPEPITHDAGRPAEFGPFHIHRLVNSSPDPAISLHLYPPTVVEARHYARYGDLLDSVDTKLIGAPR